ncbi:unnamed protein product, partial [Discosporangium mesarthrocarpum]
EQVLQGRTPCAFAGASLSLSPGESVTLTSIYGDAEDLNKLTGVIAPRASAKGFSAKKLEEAQTLVERLTDKVKTESRSPLLDGFISQVYLDNFLRGGRPSILGERSDPKVMYTFSRIHGDLERDYNFFVIDSTYFSQGPGDFRDVNQNRRTDVMTEPRVEDFNVRLFLSLTQADGYNPLHVGTSVFMLPSDGVAQECCSPCSLSPLSVTTTRLPNRSFLPGGLFKEIKDKNIMLKVSYAEFLHSIASAASQVASADFPITQTGFWSDHWTYNLDLIEAYLTVYPGKQGKEALLFDFKPLPFFQSKGQVKPRSAKYVVKKGAVRQYDCVEINVEKESALKKRAKDPEGFWQRAVNGEVFRLTVISKLVSLAVVKLATLDPLGAGVEMEGGKPGWNDAMNGLPGLIGSGTPETFELLRLIRFIQSAVESFPSRVVPVHVELDALMGAIDGHLETYYSSTEGDWEYGPFIGTENRDFKFWDRVRTALEAYRQDTKVSLCPRILEVMVVITLPILGFVRRTVKEGIDRAIQAGGGETPTYFWHSRLLENKKLCGLDERFPDMTLFCFVKAHVVPLFLEGPVRRMKILDDQGEKEALYRQVRSGPLFDKELEMYKISQSLEGQPLEIGRMRAFPPGWLENESIWMHMSFKWYLEILRGGMYDEFWKEAQRGIPPFMDSDVYGRSPLECASFIVSRQVF